MPDSRRIAGGALLLLPAGLMAYFAFNAGGFYPGATSYVAIVLCVVLVARMFGAASPFEGVGWALALAGGSLGLYALWTLLSERWSHVPGDAVVEYTRALAYLLAVVVFGSLGRTRVRVVWVVRTLAFAISAVCLCGLITRLLPHVWRTSPNIVNERLSYPVSYWNVLGLLAAFGILLCVHLTSDERESRRVQVSAAAAVPMLAATLYFTFSRGSIGVCFIGLIAYVLIARPRGLLSAAITLVPTTAVGLKVAYDATLLATPNPTTPAAVVQGRHVALALLACTVGAAVLRTALGATLDVRLLRFRLPVRYRRRVVRLSWSALALAAVIAIAVSSGTLAREYRRFVNPAAPGHGNDLRTRLLDPANDGRLPIWTIAWDQFKTAPVKGHGAGTFADAYAQYNRTPQFVQNAHSVYLETLDELGIVGMVLLGIPLVAMLVAAAWRARGPDRALYAVIFALLLSWAIEAGVDWDWQMPVVTFVVFALGALALARRPVEQPVAEAAPARARLRPQVAPYTRTAVSIGALVLAVLPAYVWLSQRDLNRATAAFSAGNCRTATDAALASINILGLRPEPYEVVAYCDVQRDLPGLAINSITKAVSLDRNNWNYVYGLGVMRAAAGYNPLPTLRRALVLNPEEPLIQQAWQTLSKDTPAQWQTDGTSIADSLTSL